MMQYSSRHLGICSSRMSVELRLDVGFVISEWKSEIERDVDQTGSHADSSLCMYAYKWCRRRSLQNQIKDCVLRF
jgi:hypothetical protein